MREVAARKWAFGGTDATLVRPAPWHFGPSHCCCCCCAHAGLGIPRDSTVPVYGVLV